MLKSLNITTHTFSVLGTLFPTDNLPLRSPMVNKKDGVPPVLAVAKVRIDTENYDDLETNMFGPADEEEEDGYDDGEKE